MLKGYKNVPIKAQPDFLHLMMYILIEMFLSFKTKLYIFVREINILTELFVLKPISCA